ncbi:MAG TPA: HEAT repeat domain-containing protein [Sphingomicrobium sp.]|jgi:HEAT repeat protein|nr:HEAT repeat domain-containing protein [Sphingomicrobium sp.]
MLRLIWDVSLLLASSALAVMMILVLLRVGSTRRRDRLQAARRHMAPLLLETAAPPGDGFDDIPDSVVTQLTLDLIQLVRGAERMQFVQKAASLGVPERLRRQAHSWSRRRRMVAVQGLALFDDATSRDALIERLGDRDDDIRLAAALALARSETRPGLDELIARLALRDERSSLLTISLFRHYANHAPDEVQALVLDSDLPLSVRLAAIEALAVTGDYRLVPAIVALGLRAPGDSEELPRYLHALGRIGHPAAREAVLAGLASNSMPARVAAAGAAGRIALAESADQLVDLLGAPEWWVRFRAAEALLLLGEAGVARLREIAAQGADPAREAAATMLAERGIAP